MMEDGHNSTKVFRAGTAALVAAVFVLTACVSNKVSAIDTGSQSVAAQNDNTQFDPEQRELAIEEIRAKASQPGSGELTNAFADPDGPNEPMNERQKAAQIRELEANAASNGESVTDAELAEKQSSIRELQNQAKNHYKNAVNNIQN